MTNRIPLAGLRCWLIRKLAGKCFVMLNADFYGEVHLKGPWLLNDNVIAQGAPTSHSRKWRLPHSSKSEILCTTGS